MKTNMIFTIHSMKILIKKLAIIACIMALPFSSPVFSESTIVKKPYISFAKVGKETMLVAHNMDVSQVLDIQRNGVSVLADLKKGIDEEGVLFSINDAGDSFLQIRSVKAGENLMRGKITITLASGEKVTYTPPANLPPITPVFPSSGPVAESILPSYSPEVKLSGQVLECVYQTPAWWNLWSTTQWKAAPNVTVSATRGGYYKSSVTNTAGNYAMIWAQGTACTSTFTVKAQKSNGIYVTKTASVNCWGYSSTASLATITFSNGIDYCGM
jgi:hypothetical protein